MERKIIEAGHYYSAYGPTKWSQLGVDILKKVSQSNDETILFIDDFHTISNVSTFEKKEDVIKLDFYPDHTILESEMVQPALAVLDQLLSLPSKKRASLNKKDNKYYISGFPITNSHGVPLCVLLDAALTVHKYNLGFNHILNILPKFYEHEQENLIKILNKLDLPNLFFSIILFNENGNFEQLQKYPAHLNSVHKELIPVHISI